MQRGESRTGRALFGPLHARTLPTCAVLNAAARARMRIHTSLSRQSWLQPPEPIEGDAYAQGLPELPGSLESAIQAFQSDLVLRQALDERFSDYFVTSRAWELKAFRETVTEWERDRYMRSV